MSERVSLTGAPTHKCAMPHCRRMVSDRFLMCVQHWFKVPRDIQTAIYREYFDGLRKQKHPTRAYATEVARAVDHVSRVEKPREAA